MVRRIARHLERRGLLVRDAENSYLEAGTAPGTGIESLLGHSITYRIAVGANEGCVFHVMSGRHFTPGRAMVSWPGC